MTILDTLKSLLGLESRDRRPEADENVGVTVEREVGEGPDASSERSVKGVGESSADDGSVAETALSGEPRETGGATGSTAAETGDDRETVEADETDEVDDTDEGEETDVTDDTVEIEQAEEDETDAGVGTDESPDVLDGIGPAYAERLSDAGVETVADLAAADASSLAEEADVSESRVERWIEQARDR